MTYIIRHLNILKLVSHNRHSNLNFKHTKRGEHTIVFSIFSAKTKKKLRVL